MTGTVSRSGVSGRQFLEPLSGQSVFNVKQKHSGLKFGMDAESSDSFSQFSLERLREGKKQIELQQLKNLLKKIENIHYSALTTGRSFSGLQILKLVEEEGGPKAAVIKPQDELEVAISKATLVREAQLWQESHPVKSLLLNLFSKKAIPNPVKKSFEWNQCFTPEEWNMVRKGVAQLAELQLLKYGTQEDLQSFVFLTPLGKQVLDYKKSLLELAKKQAEEPLIRL